MQLVSSKVRLFDPMKSKIIGEKEVIEKFGVSPEKVIEVQSLAGDTSDNIPGVQGVGIKTAADLIQKYGSLDNLYKNIDKIPQKKERNINKNKNNAYLSKKLVKLKDDVPVKENLENFELKEVNKDKLLIFLEKWNLIDY